MSHNVVLLFNPVTGGPIQNPPCSHCGVQVPAGGFTGKCPANQPPQQQEGNLFQIMHRES